MEHVDESTVAQEVAQLHDSIQQEIKDHPEEGPIPPYMMPVFSAGHWLGKRLKDAGATDQEEKDACFAFGQRACMAGAPRAYAVAAQCFNAWVDGHRDKPGRQLAEDLCTKAGIP